MSPANPSSTQIPKIPCLVEMGTPGGGFGNEVIWGKHNGVRGVAEVP